MWDSKDYLNAITKKASDSELYSKGFADARNNKKADEGLLNLSDDYYHGYQDGQLYTLTPQQSAPQHLIDMMPGGNNIPRDENVPLVPERYEDLESSPNFIKDFADDASYNDDNDTDISGLDKFASVRLSCTECDGVRIAHCGLPGCADEHGHEMGTQGLGSPEVVKFLDEYGSKIGSHKCIGCDGLGKVCYDCGGQLRVSAPIDPKANLNPAATNEAAQPGGTDTAPASTAVTETDNTSADMMPTASKQAGWGAGGRSSASFELPSVVEHPDELPVGDCATCGGAGLRKFYRPEDFPTIEACSACAGTGRRASKLATPTEPCFICKKEPATQVIGEDEYSRDENARDDKMVIEPFAYAILKDRGVCANCLWDLGGFKLPHHGSKGDQTDCAECGAPATHMDVRGYLELCDNCFGRRASKGDQKNCAECGKPATHKDVRGYLELCDDCANKGKKKKDKEKKNQKKEAMAAPWNFWRRNRGEYDMVSPLGESQYQRGDLVVGPHFKDAIGRVVAPMTGRHEAWVDWFHPNGVQVASVTDLDTDLRRLPKTRKVSPEIQSAMDEMQASTRKDETGRAFPENQGAWITTRNLQIKPKVHNYEVGDYIIQRHPNPAHTWYGVVSAVDPESNRIAAEFQHSTGGQYMTGVVDANQVERISNPLLIAKESDIRRVYDLPDFKSKGTVASTLGRFRRV